MGVSLGKYIKELNNNIKMVLPYAKNKVSGNDVFFVYDVRHNAYCVDVTVGNKFIQFNVYNLSQFKTATKPHAKCELLQKNRLNNNEVSLEIIFVNDQYRGLGIGSQLLHIAEYVAKQQGYNKINGLILGFDEQMFRKTYEFYNKNGYKLVEFSRQELTGIVEKSLTHEVLHKVETKQTVVQNNGINFHILPPKELEQPLQNYYGQGKAM